MPFTFDKFRGWDQIERSLKQTAVSTHARTTSTSIPGTKARRSVSQSAYGRAQSGVVEGPRHTCTLTREQWRERVRTLRQLSVWAPTDNQNRLSRSQSSIEGDFYFWRDMTYDWSQRCKGVVTQYSSGQLVQRQLIQHGHNTHQSSAVSDHKDPTLFIQH